MQSKSSGPKNFSPETPASLSGSRLVGNIALFAGFLVVMCVLVWQAITSGGAPDPTAANISPAAVIMNTAILVFREGLEAILVLAALTASLIKNKTSFWKPIAIGSALSFVATIPTWFLVVALLSSISASALDIQAGTGLAAIFILLVIMNWFFHSVYWTGWISIHNKKRKELTESTSISNRTIFRGLLALGFTAVYREGFEIVLFLQTLRLRAGTQVVCQGAAIGLALTAIVAVIMFVLNYRLPYKKMLVCTGVMLGFVLLVMVGESVQEMQQANWISATSVDISLPDWMNIWFAFFPTIESMSAQAFAALLVIGSFFLARRRVYHAKQRRSKKEVELDEKSDWTVSGDAPQNEAA